MAAVTELLLLAQAVDPTAGWTEIVATYGPFAPFAALLLWLLKMVWNENKAKDEEIRRLTDTAMEKVLPTVLEATSVISEANNVVTQASVTSADMHQLSTLLKDLMTRVDDLTRDLQRLQNDGSSLPSRGAR